LIEKLLAIGGLQNLLKELRHLNQLEAHLTESEQNVVKLESWNSMLSQQIEELHGQQEDREEMISEMRT
jgi:septal ring factor EnvC (AmiA/AmiB activator)